MRDKLDGAGVQVHPIQVRIAMVEVVIALASRVGDAAEITVPATAQLDDSGHAIHRVCNVAPVLEDHEALMGSEIQDENGRQFRLGVVKSCPISTVELAVDQEVILAGPS